MVEPTNYATVQEAAKRWCPRTKPDQAGRTEGACIAGDCMAWRWKGLRWANGQSEPTGYCGLAALPLGSGPRSP